jgi:dynein heavy chain
MDESTTLADLLSLNLHNFEDDVRNIVDKAVKEMSMEKVLKELDVTWAQMEFEHDPHPRTKITMLKTSEELIETLEDNQVLFFPSIANVSGICNGRIFKLLSL